MVLQLQIEDPTVNVEDIEKYKLAFMMQFFVQHKQRFRFPRLRLQDLYQQVITEPDPTALCDCVARILRFLRHSDPSVCINSVDESLDYFVAEKRTTYRIAVQNTRNGRLVGELDAPSRARLLENLIESVYDEQPDFTFASSAGFTSTAAPGRPGLRPEDATKPGFGDQTSDSEDMLPEDVNVLIKAGQDANGCSYYYMDDLRLYRESPQGGLSSHWSVAVGPTAYQWCTFISSLSQTEEEADLGSFLRQELFVLVQESFDAMELHACNTELQPRYLLNKEAGELTEIRRRRGLPPALPTPIPVVLSPNSEEKSPGGAAAVASPVVVTAGGEQHHFSPTHASNAVGSVAGCVDGGDGSSASTCPLTPTAPARTPSSMASVSSISSCSSVSAAPFSSLSFTPRPLPSTPPTAEPSAAAATSVHVKKEPSTAPNTPGAPAPWTPEAQGLAVSKPYQHPNSVGPPCGLTNSESNFPASPAPGTITKDVDSSSPHNDIFDSPARPASAVQYRGSTPKIQEEFIKSEPQSASVYDGDRKGSSSFKSGDLCPFNSPPASTRLRPLGPGSAGVMLSNSGSANFSFGSSNCTPHTNGPRDSPNAQLQHQTTDGMTTSGDNQLPGSTVQHPRSAPPYTSRHQFASGNCSSVAVAACQSPSAAGSAQQLPPPSRPSPTTTTITTSMTSANEEHVNAKSAAGLPPTSEADASLKRSPSQQTTTTAQPTQQQQQSYMRPGPHHYQAQLHHNQYYYPSSGLPPPPYGAPHALIFTTQLANEAAAEFARSHTRIAVFHHQRTLAMGKVGAGLPAAAATIIPGPGSDAAALTQEQWENRKSKIAQLEKIHSTLSKSKSASTPGVATVALQQQQQHLYGGHPPQMGAGAPPPMAVVNQGSPALTGTGTSCQPRLARPDTLEAQREWDRLCMDHLRKKESIGLPPQVPAVQAPSVPQDPRQIGPGVYPQQLAGAGGGAAPMRPVNPAHPDVKSSNQMIFNDGRSQFPPGGQQDMMDPSCSLGGGGGGMQMPGPPVLVVPPNNACGYPSSRYIDCGAGPYPQGSNSYQTGPGAPLPPAAGHKRSYSSSLKSGPVTGLPDHPAGGGGDQLPPYMGVEFGVNGLSCAPPEFWSPTMSGGPCDPLGGPMCQSVSPGFSSSGPGVCGTGGPLPTELLDSAPNGPGGPGFVPAPVSVSLPVASAPSVGGSGGRSNRSGLGKKRKSAAANRGGGSGSGSVPCLSSTMATTVISSSPVVTSCCSTGGVVSSPARCGTVQPYSLPGGPVQRVPPTNAKQQQQVADACGRLSQPHPVSGVTDHWPPPPPPQQPFNSSTHPHQPQMVRTPLGSGHYPHQPPPGIDPSGHQNHISANGMANFRGGGCHVDYSGIAGGYLSPGGDPLSAVSQQTFPTSASAVMASTAAVSVAPTCSSTLAPTASSSSTQHLTSTSLARLARLSQLTGSEGVFPTTSTAPVATTTTATVPSSTVVNGPIPNSASLPPPTTCTVGNCGSLYNRILPNNGPDPCHFMSVLPQTDGDVYPVSSCPTTTYSNVLSTQQTGCSSAAPPLPGLSPSLSGPVMACRSSTSDPSAFTSSASTPAAAVVSQPQQAPPHQCAVSQQSSHDRISVGHPVSTATSGPPAGAPVPPQAPQQQHSQPLPSIQVNNTFFNAQLNVQQMNYQHVNGSGSSSQMQIHFVQQHQQQQNLRPPSAGVGCSNGPVPQMPPGGSFYGNGPGAGLPPFSQAPSSQQQQHPMIGKPMEATARSGIGAAAAASGNQGNANVQITPKTPHTIQYLPAASTFPPGPPSSNPGYPAGTATAPSGLMYGGQGPPSEPYFAQGFHPGACGPPPPSSLHKLSPTANLSPLMMPQQPPLQSTTNKAPLPHSRMISKCSMLPASHSMGQVIPPALGMYHTGTEQSFSAAGMHGSSVSSLAADGMMLQHAGVGGSSSIPPRMMRQRVPPTKPEQSQQQHPCASSGGVSGMVVGGAPPPPPGTADISTDCMYSFKPNSMFPMAPEGCDFQVGGGGGPPMSVGTYPDHEMNAGGGGSGGGAAVHPGQPLPASSYHQRGASYRDPTSGFPSYPNAAQRCTPMGSGGGLQSCLEMSMSSVSSTGFPGGLPQSSAVGKMICQSSATLVSEQQPPHYMPGGPRWQPSGGGGGGGPPPCGTAVSGGDFYGPPRGDMCTNNPQLAAAGGSGGMMMMSSTSSSAQHYYQHGSGQTSNPGLPSAQSVRAYQTLM